VENDAKALLAQMTLEEKAALTTGSGIFATQGVERLGVPSICMSDGPHGVRKIRPDSFDPLEPAFPATCFPTASALAATWDTALVRQVGEAIGQECLALDVQVLLGPGVNIKRTPLCGRNFEYYSEDPVLAGEIGAAFVQGVQSRGVGTSLKHFACNNQEFERMTTSAEVDERTLREIYLPAFERVVRTAPPWTVMSAYNRVNGVPASEHPQLLGGILKGEWGFDGLIVSDWGAVNHRDRALAAGLDLEMPASGPAATERLVRMVHTGLLPEQVVDEAASRVLQMVMRGVEHRQPGATFDATEHHDLARRAAAEALVLLKNEGGLLPLGGAERVALIGRFAKHPRIQGQGSAHVNPTRIDCLFDALSSQVPLQYAEGYPAEDVVDEALISEAVAAARSADVAVIFAGLPDLYESEAYDRKHLDLPPAQNRLIAEVCRVQPRTVVVLACGSAIAMPWFDLPAAIVQSWLAGQAAGNAVADVLLGSVSPAGRLSETFPVRLEDTPAYCNYPGDEGRVRYGEGLFVGYRYYDRVKVKPLFPFGFGLSYTTFAYSGLTLDKAELTDRESLEVTVTVRNTGARAGKEVVQLYVRDVQSTLTRPVKELKAFAKVSLAPGEEQQIRFTLAERDFACYSVDRGAWFVETGDFEVLVGPSSAETPLRAVVRVESTAPEAAFGPFTLFKRFWGHPVGGPLLRAMLEEKLGVSEIAPQYLEFVQDMPLVKVAHLLSMGTVTEEDVVALAEKVNRALK